MGGDVGGASKTKSEPNVVPLCDILLVLLIIFMVVTPMIKKGANIKLPEASNVKVQPDAGKMVTIELKADGTIFLDNTAIPDIANLTTAIEDQLEKTKQNEKTKVLLKADMEVAYGKVTEVMDEIRRAQIEIVGLVFAEKVSAVH